MITGCLTEVSFYQLGMSTGVVVFEEMEAHHRESRDNLDFLF